MRQSLDCINQIRLAQNEIRLIQHNNSYTFPGNKNQAISSTSDPSIKPSVANMRRGVLMSILQQAALTLPLWVGEIEESSPPL